MATSGGLANAFRNVSFAASGEGLRVHCRVAIREERSQAGAPLPRERKRGCREVEGGCRQEGEGACFRAWGFVGFVARYQLAVVDTRWQSPPSTSTPTNCSPAQESSVTTSSPIRNARSPAMSELAALKPRGSLFALKYF